MRSLVEPGSEGAFWTAKEPVDRTLFVELDVVAVEILEEVVADRLPLFGRQVVRIESIFQKLEILFVVFIAERHISSFLRLPNQQMLYWLSDAQLATFELPKIGEYCQGEGKNVTGNNEKFVRFWWEVSFDKFGRENKWLTYSKGGPYRRWFANLEYVVDWSESARNHYRSNHSSRIVTGEMWYRDGVTWTDITSKGVGFLDFGLEGEYDDSRLEECKAACTFYPDEDNVIPMLDGDWFSDDITERFKKFLQVTFAERRGGS